MKTVTFCGHRTIDWKDKEPITRKLFEELEKLIKQGATEFLLGGYGSFDRLCAVVIDDLKIKYSDIKSILVIPYLNREYDTSLYDYTEYPPIEKTPLKFAISKRNEYMVNKSDVVISYVKHSWGGAATTLEYAQRKKKQIISII